MVAAATMQDCGALAWTYLTWRQLGGRSETARRLGVVSQPVTLAMRIIKIAKGRMGIRDFWGSTKWPKWHDDG